ncbi:MAG: pyridoxal phosphate-dependent aminotransferase [Candidatus Dependentiae bacterium]|nr:pyridoxal phosphate-dependent aminotransferase [Candidatus Dependentiae bacterium]
MRNKTILLLSLCIVTLVAATCFKVCSVSVTETKEHHTLFKPNGTPAGTIDTLMLLNMWTHHVDEQLQTKTGKSDMIFAGIGKPSYFLNEDLARSAADYWQSLVDANTQLVKSISQKNMSVEDNIETIRTNSTAIDYGDLAGELPYRTTMAQALSAWHNTSIHPDDIIFSVGGAGALRMLFKIINEKKPHGRIIATAPFYPFYNNETHGNNLHLIDLLKEPGYRLTAKAVQKSIDTAQELAQKDGHAISAFLFCDPNNPLGFIVGQEEWKNIAHVLKNTPADIPIILDEAYAEVVCGDKQHESLLTAAPELKDRIVLFRSTTKGFSASGERMAVIVCHNKELRENIINEGALAYLHLPRSLQYAYSQGMLHFTPEKRKQLSNHYTVQTEYVQNRLKQMNIQMPDPAYKVQGTFYVLADLHCLFGTQMPAEAKKVLGKTGLISTDEELCYSLLLDEHIMISPLSYFGADPKLGYVRITCSGGITELTELLNRLEKKIAMKKLSLSGIEARNS